MTISFQELKQKPIVITPISKNTDQCNNIQSVKLSKTKEDNHSQKLLLALGGLAVLSFSAFYIYRNKKVNIKTTEQIIDYAKNNLLKNSDISSYINNLDSQKNGIFAKNLLNYQNKPISFLHCIQNPKASVSVIDKLFALDKTSNFLHFPNLIYISGANNETRKNITKVMADYYAAEYKQTKYTKGYLKEFVKTLQENSKNKEATFLYIDNIDSFITDLSNPEHVEILADFKNLLKNKVNKTMFVIDKNVDNKLFERKQLNFSFYDEINKFDFGKKLEEIEYKNFHRISDIEYSLIKDVEMFIPSTSVLGIANKSFDENVWTFAKNNDNFIDILMKKIVAKTDDFYEKVSMGNDLKNVINDLEKRLVIAQELFDRTERKTFLYVDDFAEAISKSKENSAEFIKLSELLKKTKNSHLMVIFDNNGEKQIENLLFDNNHVKNLEFNLERIRENLFDYESLGKKGPFFKNYLQIFSQFLDVEKRGTKIPSSNGILLYGDSDKIDKAENIIKNTMDLNFQESKYDPNKPFESIKKLVAIAEKAEEQYAITKKRTMISLLGWDELLTHEELQENRRMIGKFKQFVEHCSEYYHTTVLMKTTKALDDFEDASIASHRFERKFEFKS